MYRRDAILEVMCPVSIGENLIQILGVLEQSRMGLVEIPAREFDECVRWEEDMKAYFVRRAEAQGGTNVSSRLMGLA